MPLVIYKIQSEVQCSKRHGESVECVQKRVCEKHRPPGGAAVPPATRARRHFSWTKEHLELDHAAQCGGLRAAALACGLERARDAEHCVCRSAQRNQRQLTTYINSKGDVETRRRETPCSARTSTAAANSPDGVSDDGS